MADVKQGMAYVLQNMPATPILPTNSATEEEFRRIPGFDQQSNKNANKSLF